jgi:hypothetical protein
MRPLAVVPSPHIAGGRAFGASRGRDRPRLPLDCSGRTQRPGHLAVATCTMVIWTGTTSVGGGPTAPVQLAQYLDMMRNRLVWARLKTSVESKRDFCWIQSASIFCDVLFCKRSRKVSLISV